MTARLRAVRPSDPTPEQAWVALSAEIAALETRLTRLRQTRAALKPGIMSGMKAWGLSDTQITATLRGATNA